ncbi:winged helix-turn-helix transcriptional regulator [Paenarthrobacter sp. NPDC056912]|uniref:winged helix-turn-helix transcriptional regulator n=1 Tax=Paenarthrobacter sp. NPDC056912 TaxID=3345965 RepID=UPI003670F66D
MAGRHHPAHVRNRDALDGKRRFSEFEKSLGVAKNILSDRLRLLVERGILIRIPNERGTRSEYELSETGRPVPPLRPLAEDGTELRPEHTLLVKAGTPLP